MKSLNAQMKKDKAAHIEMLRRLAAEVEEAISTVNGLIRDYNEALEEARDWRDDLTGQMQDFYDDKSDKWQEGEAGSDYMTWKDEWEAADLDGEVDEIDPPDLSHYAILEDLPDAP